MSKYLWSLVTRDNVLKAIEIFDLEQPKHPPARNTFLIFNNQKYPAKHIRGMAYKVAFNEITRKDEYTGGDETVKFFSPLGFDVWYRGIEIKGNEIL